MKIDAEEITLNGITYVPKGENKAVLSIEGLECCVIRTYSAGVFYGYVKSRNGMEVELLHSKRIWAWYGAASLSQLAVEGVSRPDKCKIPIAIPRQILTQVIEVIPLTERAFKSLESVPVWKA